jgi:lantibiotic modifying enzyme
MRGCDKSADALQIARRIGERLAQMAVCDGDRASWATLCPTISSHIASVPASIQLYDGLPGIALFLCYLGEVTRATGFTDLARAATREFSSPLFAARYQGAGSFEGLGGTIYALVHIAKFLPALNCNAKAARLARLCVDEIDATVEVDLLAGLAGVILCALAAARKTRRKVFFELAVKAGTALMRQVSKPKLSEHGTTLSGRKWPTSFAHGRAGIAYALLKLSETTNQKSYEVAALKLLKREIAQIRRGRFRAPQLSMPHAISFSSAHAWCHSPLGVAIALNAARSRLRQSRQILEDILVRLDRSDLEPSDCLCHGNLGNLLIAQELQESGDRISKSIVATLATKIMKRIVDRGVVCGNLGFETPGLMEGLAGIGLALLRLAAPTSIPNVLVFGLPAVDCRPSASKTVSP